MKRTHQQRSRRSTATGAFISRKRAGVLLVGALAAGVAFSCLPQAVFKTEALIGVGSPETPLREAMTEAAASAAVSKPVMARAAASLVGTNIAVPEPGPLDRIWVALTLDRAAGHDARLAGTLADMVDAKAGDAPGVVKIQAINEDPGTAAQVATAVAEALVAEQEVQAVELRHRREIVSTHELEGLKTNAQAARRRFTALGGTDVDPAQARTAAAAQLASAQARLDVVRAIIASSTPPVSDRHDLPQNVAALQAAYLDVSQQLSKARETLGDRHSTVISLQDGVKQAAAGLIAEWKRLAKVAQGELDAARAHAAALTAAKVPDDVSKRAELDEARRVLSVAEDALEQAQNARRDPSVDDHEYRLVAQAPAPSQATGLELTPRLLLALLAGLAGMGAVRILAGISRMASALPMPAATAPRLEPVAMPATMEGGEPRAVSRHERETLVDVDPPMEADHELDNAMRDMLPALDSIVPQGDLPVVLVGAHEAGTPTTPIVLALSSAVAEAGLRVLVVEASATGLAAAVERDAEPVLVDLFGTLRIALRAEAEAHDGLIYLAPTFRNGDRIVAGLSRADDIPLVDDVAAEFDLVIIDAGEAKGSVRLAPFADAFLRVGRHASKRDDDAFLATCDATRAAFLGTITASALAPKPAVEPLHVVRAVPDQAQPIQTPSRRVPLQVVPTERRRAGVR